MSRLREAAQALIARWDTPGWKDAAPTANFVEALRDALANHAQNVCAGRMCRGDAHD